MVKVAIGTWGLQNWFDGDFAPVIDLMRRADEGNIDQVSITSPSISFERDVLTS